MPHALGFRIWLAAFAVSTASAAFSIWYVDRPLAEFFEVQFRHTHLWSVIDRLLAPLVLVVIAALLFLFCAGAWVLSRRRLVAWAAKPLTCSGSVIWAVAAEFVLKEIFGRGWPDPTYVQNHFYGFHFLHASEHWSSFPSGTATITAALTASIWLLFPAWRFVSLFLALTICLALVITNDHWLSDVIAGAFLGTSIGWMSVLLSGKFGNPV